MTPKKALELLRSGNQRFLDMKPEIRDVQEQISDTSSEQFPFAVVLGCIDSRVPPELIFDLGIGDIFCIRIAGNIINEDILASIEFATKVVGAKHILVLGHTSCGAIQSAVDQVALGNLTGLVNKLQPVVNTAWQISDDPEVDQISELNVKLTIQDIKDQSPILKELIDQGKISISGGMYDVGTGVVRFL